MASTDDTQPRSPFGQQAKQQKRDTQESAATHSPAAGPGCFVWGFMLLMGMACSLTIVVLAGTAGWTEGHRIADATASATLARGINIQLERIPTDVANGNLRNLGVRLEFLATFTPGVPGVPQLRETATALFLTSQPTLTLTPTPSETPTASPEPVEQTAEATPEDAGAPGTGAPQPTASLVYDLDSLLADAQLHIRFNEYDQAYDTLDAIIRIDENFQRTVVRAMMNEVLIAQAAALYHSTADTDLAEAIRLTDLAEEYGAIGELDYERLIAGMYLDIQRAMATYSYATAIQLLHGVRGYQDAYRGHDFRVMLFNAYVAYGDAWGLGGDYCQAATQYDLALNYYADSVVQTKRDQAQTACEQALTATATYPGGAPPTTSP